MGLTIGVDIGGTKIAAGVVDEEGTILETYKVPTPPTADGVTDAICAAVSEVSSNHTIDAVGIGAAGYVDDKRATVLFAPEHQLAPRAAQGQGRAAHRPAGRRRERRELRGLGRVPLRRRPGPRGRHLHHARHRPGRRHHHRQQAAARTLRRRRRVRAHPGRPRRPAVRLRQPGLLGAVRLRARARPVREAARQRHPRERGDPARPRRRHPRGHRGQAHQRRPRGRATWWPSTPSASWPAGPAPAWPTWPRSSTRRRSSSAAASPTRATSSSTRSASPSSAG